MEMSPKQTIRVALLLGAAGWIGTEAAAQTVINWGSLTFKGEVSPRPWCGQYWAYRHDGIAVTNKLGRFPDALSPAEKLDELLGRKAKIEREKLDAWRSCALASWSACQNLADTERARCLRDSAKQRKHRACAKGFTVDTAYEWEVVNHGRGAFGWDRWWGHSNGWAAAAVLFSEPVKPVTLQGVTFTVADVKALLTEALMDVNIAADGWFGCRYNGPGETLSSPACPTAQDAYEDVTPQELLSAFSKHIGDNQHAVIIDRNTDVEVWNHPVWKYEVRDCRESTGSPCGPGEVKQTCMLSFTWAEDGVGHHEVCEPPHGYTTRMLAFSVCLKDRMVLGDRNKQRWEVPAAVAKSERWPDFIWLPETRATKPHEANPFVHEHFAKILELYKLSAGKGGIPPNPRTARDYTQNVRKPIPDQDPRGLAIPIRVPTSMVVKTVAVCVDIDHPSRGDLVVKVRGPNGQEVPLWKNQRGAEDNLKDCAGTTGFIHLDARGTWTVTVADTVAGDTGTLNSVTLRLAQ
jgi:hypothetical protein